MNLRDQDAVVATRDVFGPGRGPFGPLKTAAGTRLAKNDPRVDANRDSFVPVLTAGVDRERALLATTTLTAIGSDRDVRVVYAGQLVSDDDPMVALDPYHFELPQNEE